MTVTAINDDLLDDEIVQNPSPYYARLREQHPCYWNERWRGWVLSRYDDVYGAMHSSSFLADRITPWYMNRLNEEERDRYKVTYDALRSFVVFTDPRTTRGCEGSSARPSLPRPCRRCARSPRTWSSGTWINGLRAGRWTSMQSSPTRCLPT